jgi:hypothetical protein
MSVRQVFSRASFPPHPDGLVTRKQYFALKAHALVAIKLAANPATIMIFFNIFLLLFKLNNKQNTDFTSYINLDLGLYP